MCIGSVCGLGGCRKNQTPRRWPESGMRSRTEDDARGRPRKCGARCAHRAMRSNRTREFPTALRVRRSTATADPVSPCSLIRKTSTPRARSLQVASSTGLAARAMMRSWNHRSAWQTPDGRRSQLRGAWPRWRRRTGLQSALSASCRSTMRRNAMRSTARRNSWHLLHLIGGEFGHVRAAIGLGAHDALRLQQRNASRTGNPAHTFQFADLFLEDALPGLEFARRDHDDQLVRQLIRKVPGVQCCLSVHALPLHRSQAQHHTRFAQRRHGAAI